MNNNNIKLSLVSMLVFSTNINAAGLDDYNELHSSSERFVRNTCAGLIKVGQNRNALENDLFGACRSMVQTANVYTASEQDPTTFSRGLTATELAGGYQNIVSEETFAPLTISAQASLGQYSSIASHINKIRKGSFGLASFQQHGKSFDLADAKPEYPTGGAAGDDGLLSGSRLGFFANTIGAFGETEKTERENESDFHSIGVIAGVDFRVLDNLTVGLAGGYSHLNLDFAQNMDVNGGGVEADNYNISAYLTFYSGDFYVDGIFTYGWSDYDIDRKIDIASNNQNISTVDRATFATPEGEQFNASLSSGYNFHTGGLTYGPYVRVTYLNSSIDGYSEQGATGLNMRIGDQEVDSLESIVGGQISYAYSQTFAVIVPHVRVEWHHEYFDSAREFKVAYVNDPNNNSLMLRSDRLDGDYFNVGAGVSANFKHGLQAFVDYETVLELKNVESHIFTLGLRLEF
ncbi:MAG: autotransporter outer membrane beta-barrel domain-containing protein [Methylococcales bacterium]|nr:autotransporter outer membrane beta-barrel domain-containing protein [Methylococcales bacterium]